MKQNPSLGKSLPEYRQNDDRLDTIKKLYFQQKGDI